MLRSLERFLWLIAIIAFAVYAGSWTERWVFQTYLNWKFPDEGIVLRRVGHSTLTLVTCYPFLYVGSAPKRFVVHASLVTEAP